MVPADESRRLIKFVQGQFARENLWCWETIFEEVSEAIAIGFDADRLVYAGGTVRTGRHEFRCNNPAWKEKCKGIATSEADAYEVVSEVIAALTSNNAIGTAQAWLQQRRDDATKLASDLHQLLDGLLSWQGFVYRGRRDYNPELRGTEKVIYGLWRLDRNEQPIAPLPLNVGETKDTVYDRLSKNHANWWGDKPIGVTFVPVQYDRSERKRIEKLLQDALIPLANCDGKRLDRLKKLWTFARP
ncbi:MAG TPA: hypothetical protein VIL86_02005 [Tepidisphaeraceae bacterium]|jgi:hypothetical protein